MIFSQMIINPARAAMHPRDVWVFPGYPPSPFFHLLACAKILYVHDLFLMTRLGDLNWPARLYMALPFRLAVRRFRYFFVNSLTTGQATGRFRTAPTRASCLSVRLRAMFSA